jgi:hypothetical protein
MPARRSSSLNRAGNAGFTISSPSRTLRLTSEPGPTPTSSASERGIRTPRLFPHFWIRVCKAWLRLYDEYTPSWLRRATRASASISLTPRSEAGSNLGIGISLRSRLLHLNVRRSNILLSTAVCWDVEGAHTLRLHHPQLNLLSSTHLLRQARLRRSFETPDLPEARNSPQSQ